MSKGKRLPQQIEAERIAGLEQNPTDLKTHQEQFDQANYAINTPKTRLHHSPNVAAIYLSPRQGPLTLLTMVGPIHP